MCVGGGGGGGGGGGRRPVVTSSKLYKAPLQSVAAVLSWLFSTSCIFAPRGG